MPFCLPNDVSQSSILPLILYTYLLLGYLTISQRCHVKENIKLQNTSYIRSAYDSGYKSKIIFQLTLTYTHISPKKKRYRLEFNSLRSHTCYKNFYLFTVIISVFLSSDISLSHILNDNWIFSLGKSFPIPHA